jgi:phosphomannomutase/phosphoglucomutase
MELKQKLGEVPYLSTKKHVDRKLILALGLFGLALIIGPAWMKISDFRNSGVFSETRKESEQSVADLLKPVQDVQRVMDDEQVQALALRTLENPDTVDDLTAYIKGRINRVTAARVFGADLSRVRPSTLGPNGFALYDMIHFTLTTGKGLMQVHNILQPPRLMDSTAIRSGDHTVGVLVVELDPEYLLAGYDPQYSALGLIRLTQYNGREPVSVIREWGDPGRLGEVPDRINVPGTLFRVEFPLYQYVEYLGFWPALLAILAGIVGLGAAYVLYRRNLEWEKEEALNKARAGTPAVFTPEPDDDAYFEPVPNRPGPAVVEVPEEDDAEPPPAPAAAISDPPRMHLHYDLNERRKLKEADHEPVELIPGIFRAYDIRGVIDKTLDSGVARSVGQAVGTVTLEKNAGPVVVARDGRLSGPYLMEGMIEGILSTGCDVLDIGAVPTGVLYYAAFEMGQGSGVMITGSHNPPDYNGFKIMVGGESLHGAAIGNLYHRIKTSDLLEGEGSLDRRDVVPDYIKRIASDIKVERDLKVVIDCGNGIGGVCAADTLRAIGVEVLPLFDEVDGTFPNHHPDPSEPENLSDLIESVRLMDADLGLALDGDADRLGVVTLAGNIIYPDRVMMLLALDVLDRNPGATILYDVKCTGHLPKVIREAGGNPVMYKTGHSLMKARMKELGSPFAGEMSGHFFFGERWYGVDDGIYAAARLLEILGSTAAPPEAILNALPTSYSTPELKVEMQEGENHEFVRNFQANAKFTGATISTIDGLRADFEDGWGLVRASNTTPILVVRFDAETEEALSRIKSVFRTQLLNLKPDLVLPF